MALIDVRCLTCDTVSEVYRAAKDWPATPACPKCDAPTEQAHRSKGLDTNAPAVVVYKMPDGSFRFPGDPNSAQSAKYRDQGGQRVELRGWQEIRPFEREVNKQEYSKICRRVERQQQAQEEGERIRRSDFNHGLHHGLRVPVSDGHGGTVMKTVQMSARARDIGRILMERNNKKRVKGYEPGFRVEVYSENRGSRDESRDHNGRRFRD